MNIRYLWAGIGLAATVALTICPLATSAKTTSTASHVVSSRHRLLKARVSAVVSAADILMAKGKYADAADLYHQAVNRNSKDTYAIDGLGMALARQFKLDAASEQFDKALKLDPRNALAHTGKAIVLMNQLQSSSMTTIRNSQSLLNQARQEAQEALSIDPNLPEAHYALGLVNKEQWQLGEAADEFRRAEKLDPRNSDALASLGLTRLMQGNTGAAITNLKQAIALNSGNSTAHYGLGSAYLKLNQVDAAIKELNTALYLYPNSAPVRMALGSAYQAQGNNVAAVREYQESIRIKAENPAPYLRIADIREGRGDIEHCLAELRSGLEMMPDNPELQLRIASESLRLEKVDDAIKEYEQVLNGSPRSTVAAEGLTRALYLKAQKETTGAFIGSNDYEQADQLIKRAIQMNPNNMELRLAQAKLRALSGEQMDLSTIGVPQTDGERIAYAEALLARNEFKDAQEQMDMVISRTSDPKQLFAIADLSLMIKDLDSAELAYRRVASMAGTPERIKRGLDTVARARNTAREDLTLADDLAKRKQLASAVDKYHQAISDNPKVPQARMGLARALERLSPDSPKDLREASTQYKAYVALDPSLPEKERDKLLKHASKIEQKAFKIESKKSSA